MAYFWFRRSARSQFMLTFGVVYWIISTKELAMKETRDGFDRQLVEARKVECERPRSHIKDLKLTKLGQVNLIKVESDDSEQD